MDDLDKECERELNPQAVIDSNVHQCQEKISNLLAEVKLLTSRLSISLSPELGAGGQTQAMVLHVKNEDAAKYTEALVQAKETELPKLFEEIKKTSK